MNRRAFPKNICVRSSSWYITLYQIVLACSRGQMILASYVDMMLHSTLLYLLLLCPTVGCNILILSTMNLLRHKSEHYAHPMMCNAKSEFALAHSHGYRSMSVSLWIRGINLYVTVWIRSSSRHSSLICGKSHNVHQLLNCYISVDKPKSTLYL